MICKIFKIRNQILFYTEMFVVSLLIITGFSYFLGARGVDGGQATLLRIIAIFLVLKFYFYLKKTMGMNDLPPEE